MNSLFLRTRESDGRRPGAPERGIRFWTHAEVPGDIWFVLECAVETVGVGIDIRRFITASFWEARVLYKTTAFEWAHLHAYVSSPTDFASGHLFQTVSEVVRVDRGDALLLRMESGLMLMVSGGKILNGPSIAVGRTVFP